MGKARLALWAAGIALAIVSSTSEARAENVLKIGSLAPSQSPWAQVLNVWKRAVRERSNKQLKIRFYWNGTQGDEAAMVEKVKTGQLQGVGVTAVGLGKIHEPILALQLPGVFGSWGALDRARASLLGEFQQGAAAKGFHILGWSDVGRMHWFSKGFAITNPASLAGRKPHVWGPDHIHRAVFQSIAGVTPVDLGVPEVLPALNSNRIDSLRTPALTCGQLQWASRFTNVVLDSDGFMIGALVIAKSSIDALPEDQKTMLVQTGELAAKELVSRIRSEDDAALNRQKGRMTTHTLTASEKAEWDALYRRARQRLGQQNVFSPSLISRIEKLGS